MYRSGVCEREGIVRSILCRSDGERESGVDRSIHLFWQIKCLSESSLFVPVPLCGEFNAYADMQQPFNFKFISSDID